MCRPSTVARREQAQLVPDSGTGAEDGAAKDFAAHRSKAQSESARPLAKPPREKGWTPLLGLTAAISLNLGIFNLLPIPILDGGVILLLFIEGLMRRDISLPIKERMYQAAFVFLVLFAVMVIYNDIVKTLGS